MTPTQAIQLLRDHNKWRRGDDTYEMANPAELGEAIEMICDIAERAVREFGTKAADSTAT